MRRCENRKNVTYKRILVDLEGMPDDGNNPGVGEETYGNKRIYRI